MSQKIASGRRPKTHEIAQRLPIDTWGARFDSEEIDFFFWIELLNSGGTDDQVSRSDIRDATFPSEQNIVVIDPDRTSADRQDFGSRARLGIRDGATQSPDSREGRYDSRWAADPWS